MLRDLTGLEPGDNIIISGMGGPPSRSAMFLAAALAALRSFLSALD